MDSDRRAAPVGKLRCCNHKLPIDAGQQQPLLGDDRKCMKCELCIVEDDVGLRGYIFGGV